MHLSSFQKSLNFCLLDRALVLQVDAAQKTLRCPIISVQDFLTHTDMEVMSYCKLQVLILPFIVSYFFKFVPGKHFYLEYLSVRDTIL